MELWAGEGKLAIFTSNSKVQKGAGGLPVLAGMSNGVVAVKRTWFGEVLLSGLPVVHVVPQLLVIVLSPVYEMIAPRSAQLSCPAVAFVQSRSNRTRSTVTLVPPVIEPVNSDSLTR